MTMSPVKTEAAPPVQSSQPSPAAVGHPKIAFFGIFGVQNLGNECTLQAILHNARERLPGGEHYSICYRPDDTSHRHNVAAVPISTRYFQSRAPSGEVVQRKGGINRLFRILFQRAPGEVSDWWKAIKALRGTDLVVMTGTGMLTDYSTSAFGFPYDVFKWSVAARLAGCKVRFVGIGVGPIYGKLSRLLIRCALSLADYRSFRDEFSKNRIKITGFDSEKDPVFPDLAFSLPKEIFPQRSNRTRQKRQVGLGIMDHRDIHIPLSEQEAAYSAYLDTMCDFISWLIAHGYGIRLLQGDVKYDRLTRADLKARLEQRGVHYDQAGIVDVDTTTVEELLAQLAESDVIVSPRFHNLLLGMMLNIPVVSISYDPKNDSLLEGVGLGKYRQPLTELNVQRLIDQFVDLEAHADDVKPMISRKAAEYRAFLDEQYQLIFGDM